MPLPTRLSFKSEAQESLKHNPIYRIAANLQHRHLNQNIHYFKLRRRHHKWRLWIKKGVNLVLQYNLTQLLFQLQQTIQSQKESICQLENNLAQLQGDLLELKQQNPVRIDKIEYNFDQLKIERLEGTLNIGLSPQDLNNIDEFAVNGQAPFAPFLFPGREEFVHQLSDEIIQGFHKDKDEIFSEAERHCSRKADGDMRSFITDDLARQVPQRINHYLDQTPAYNRHEQKLPQVREQILEVIHTDIQNAINRFLQVYPESMKEDSKWISKSLMNNYA